MGVLQCFMHMIVCIGYAMEQKRIKHNIDIQIQVIRPAAPLDYAAHLLLMHMQMIQDFVDILFCQFYKL